MIRLSLGLTLVIGALPTLALASPDTPQAALSAAPFTLTLDAPCASAITVDGAAGQQEGAVLLHEGDQVPAGLSFTSDTHSAQLEGQHCETNAHLRVPLGTAIIAKMSNYGSLRLSGINGPLSLTHKGSSEVTADQVTALSVDGNGFGSLKLGWLHGPAAITLSGSGNVTIGRVDAKSFTALSSGFGNITLSDGRIGTLDARVRGSGNFAFGGIARTATLEANGFGTVTVDTVTGSVHKDAHAPGSITIRHETAPPRSVSATHALLTLPDGTVITAHNLIKPDGTIVSFDNTASANDNSDEESSAPRHYHSGRWVLILALLLFFALRRKIGPPLSRVVTSLGLAPGQPDSATNHQPQIVELAERLKRLEKRVGEVEHCVTSRDFHLHREFHTLSRRHG
ncbi:GIN domain-containing protein [Asaia sp. HN010]|uniref:GIN domain-containing protein n=1 Tax=Asaia sp. HN010 TaxID=3081233 RepID=UPI003018B4EB